MNECLSGKCDIQTNLNRGSHFKLRCTNCGHEEPLTFQVEHGVICPRCNCGLLIWVPNTKERVNKNE